MNYSQPEFYHFSEDSIVLAKAAFDYLYQHNIQHVQNLIDVCAGCGIVGLEFIERFKNVESILFIENQQAFAEHLEFNTKQLKSKKILIQPFQQVTAQKADLILANPPYFLDHESRRSVDPRKDRCRSIAQNDLLALLSFFKVHLKNERSLAFFLSVKNIEFWEAGKMTGLNVELHTSFKEISIYRAFISCN